MTLTERVKRKALDLGFQAVGVSRVPSDRPEARRLTEWLSQDYHGDMTWMASTAAKRKNPALLLPGIRAIVSVGMSYYTDNHPDDGPGHGRIARYARGEDYHRILEERLELLAAFVKAEAPDSRGLCYVDTGAIMEKAWAQRAGLGWIGKHSNLVSGRHGSWLLLGEVLTTADLDPDEPGSDLCGTCSLCIKTCPTGAITEPYVVDARRCLSYLTIEQRGHIPDEFQAALGNRIFGCDDCLDVCPYNHQATPTEEPRFRPIPLTLNPNLKTLARQSAEDFQATFKHSAIRRATHEGLQRSVAVAEKNVGH
jgi:epoxyqueuosine reductase